MKHSAFYFGIDIGGTFVKILIMDEQRQIIAKSKIKTDITENGKNIVSDIYSELKQMLKNNTLDIDQCRAIGVGVPGQIDYENQVVIEAVNLGWLNYPLKGQLENLMLVPTFINNDANFSAYGELNNGAGIGKTNIIVLTLGTGVGAGIIVDGQIISGNCGAAGEIGHMKILFEGGRLCNCGNYGCLETLVAASGIVNIARELLENNGSGSSLYQYDILTSEIIFNEANKGDYLATLVMDKVAKYLGSSLASIGHIINPELFIIGGGISKAGEPFLQLIRKYFSASALIAIRETTDIKLALLGNDAGMIGASEFARQKMKYIEV